MRALLASDRALPAAHLGLAGLWSLHHIARTAGLPERLADHPPGPALLQALSLLSILAAVGGCVWVVWATLSRPSGFAWVCLVALAAATAVRDTRPDALDVAWLLVVVPLSVLRLESTDTHLQTE